jgi:hypothetical protein
MVQMGTYQELIASSASFRHLLDDIHQQEQEHSTDVCRRAHSRCVTLSETEDEEEEQLLTSQTLEMKEKGSVKWRVYIEYLRAGAGLILGLTLLLLVFGTRETVSVFSGWWLAEWSEDESYRHQLNNCTEARNKKMNKIRSMSDIEWTNHRNKRFYFCCGTYLTSRGLIIVLIYRPFKVLHLFL